MKRSAVGGWLKLGLGAWGIALLASAAGCAASGAERRPGAAQPAAQIAAAQGQDATGTWDWVYRSTDQQGDVRVEQEEWHLEQRGGIIEGFYDRAVTLMSSDDRLFRCNQRLGFTKVTRVRVTGQVVGDRVTLREVSFEVKPGPCDDGARNLVAYSGVLSAGSLTLNWSAEAGQTLVKRVGSAQARRGGGGGQMLPVANLSEPRGPSAATASTESAPVVRDGAVAGASVAGDWEWELRSIDAEGDERRESELWHLEESAEGITGYYERSVRRVRGEGLFSCNGATQYETKTRYTIRGQRFGERVHLSETEYHATPSTCDNTLRRLDQYQGFVNDGDSLVLSWGPGNQLLRRRR